MYAPAQSTLLILAACLRQVARATRGITFIGTPHHGAGLTRWVELLSHAIGVVKHTNAEIAAFLGESEVFAWIQDSFRMRAMARSSEGLG